RLPDEEPQNVRDPERRDEAEIPDDGVSRAEAEALLPDESVLGLADARRVKPAAPPPSPYPEDVRRKGEIPAGTRPLGGGAPVQARATPNEAAAPSVYRWTAPGARNDAPDDA